jgi:thiamine kinase-like enzyme
VASINEQLLSKTELDSKWKESYIEKHDAFVQKTLDDNDKMRVQMIDLEAKQRAVRDEFTQVSTHVKLRG